MIDTLSVCRIALIDSAAIDFVFARLVMPKPRDYNATVVMHGVKFVEPALDRDSILSENQALRQLIDEIRLQCDLLRERLPSNVSYH